jgi:hypothetical protein
MLWFYSTDAPIEQVLVHWGTAPALLLGSSPLLITLFFGKFLTANGIAIYSQHGILNYFPPSYGRDGAI